MSTNQYLTADLIELGKHQLLSINPKYLTPVKKSQMDNEFWVILDRSGSMGQFVGTVFNYLSSMLGQLRLKKVKLFTFDSISEVYTLDIKQLKSRKMSCRGSTNMTPTVNHLERELKMTRNKIIQLLVISDGEVFDKKILLGRTATLADRINKCNKTNIVHVIGIRLCTSSYANPDTQALTCIFSLNNHPSARSRLFEVRHNELSRLRNHLDKVVKIFINNNANIDTFQLQSSKCNLKLDIGERSTKDIRLLKGTNLIIVDGEAENLTLDGINVKLVKKDLSGELDINEFLKNIESKIRNWKVMGTQDIKVKQAIEFIEELDNYFRRIEQSKIKDNNIKHSIKRRISMLCQIAERRNKSFVQKILEVANLSNVDKLNSTQQANFLRELNRETKSARRIAKRSNIKSGKDLHNQIQNELTSLLLKNTKDLKEIKDIPTSFYSLCNNYDIIKGINEERQSIKQLSVEDILQCVGLVGIAFNANRGDYPEPWNFRVNKVFFGCHLSQNDLWTAHIQGNGEQLSPPGRNSEKITGVDILLTDPIFKIIGGFFINLHSSIVMRRVISPISGDAIAIKTATIWTMINQIFETGLSELKVKELYLNIETLKYMTKNGKVFKNLSKDLQEKNLAAYLTGDRNISDVMKVLAFLLSTDNMNLDLPKIFKALYSLQIYHHINKFMKRKIFEFTRSLENKKREIQSKHQINIPQEALKELNKLDKKINRATQDELRSTLLNRVFEINYEKYATRPTDIFEPEPAELKFYDKYDAEDLYSNLKKYTVHPDQLSNVCEVIESLNENRKINIERSVQDVFKFKCSLNDYITGHTIQALMCQNQKDRVNVEKREMLIPEIENEEDIQKYIKSIIRYKYETYYNKLLHEKREGERKIKLKEAIQKAIVTKDVWSEFINIMNEYIPNRDSDGYNNIVDILINEKEKVPKRLEKMWVIILGRNLKSKPIWNSGNILRGNLGEFAKFFQKKHHNSWDKIIEIRKANIIHQYRDNRANRHGHWNGLASAWAVGYSNIDEYQKELKENFRKYLQMRVYNKFHRVNPLGFESGLEKLREFTQWCKNNPHVFKRIYGKNKNLLIN